MEKAFWHSCLHVVQSPSALQIVRGMGWPGGALTSLSDLSSPSTLCLQCLEGISHLIMAKLSGSWEQWMKRVYCFGTRGLYPFLLPVLNCKLFRAETSFALTFLQHITNGALILDEVLRTTVKQINDFFSFLFLTYITIPKKMKNSHLSSSMKFCVK